MEKSNKFKKTTDNEGTFMYIGQAPTGTLGERATDELSRVGGVNAPVDSRDPVQAKLTINFLCC